MLLIPAVGIHIEEDNPSSVWKNDGECHGTMDTFYLVYEDGQKSMMELLGVRDGSALNVISAYPIYLNNNELEIICRGWAGLHSGAQIDVYGYKINEGEAVYDRSFKTEAEQAVYNAGGDSRYVVHVPVAGIKKPSLITIVFKDVNGAEHDFAEFSVNGGYGAERIRAYAYAGKEEVKARSGDKVDVKIKIDGSAELKSLTARVSWPEQLYLTNAVYEQSDGASVSIPEGGWESLDGSYDFSWSSNSGTLYGEYTFLTLTFELNGKISEISQLQVNAEILTSASETASGKDLIALASAGAEIKAYPAPSGDVNCDSEINNKDVVVLFRHVSGIEIRMFSYSAADVNGDGTIDNKDVVSLFRISTDPPEPEKLPTDNPSVISIAAVQGKYLLYGSCEPGSVLRTVVRGKEQKNAANNKYFYVTVEANSGDTALVYATAPGKSESQGVSVKINPVTSTDAVWGGKNSRIFYGGTYGFLVGNQADMSSLASLKSYITNKTIKEIQKATGKETKLIFAIIPDPATAYYDEQYDYMGTPKTPDTAMQSFVKEIDGCHKDVYALDLLSVLRAHKEDRIYFTTDTHYTEFGAYYVYLDIMNRVKQTYPSAKVRTIENGDYTVEYYDVGGGDMCGMIGMGMNEVVPFFIANFEDTGSYYVSKRNDGIKSAGFGPGGWQRDSELSSSGNPTAYFLGDSYGCYILPFIGANFSKVWTNEGVLWNYSLDKSILTQNKPDYVILLVCQRNVGPNFMSNLVSQFCMSVSGF